MKLRRTCLLVGLPALCVVVALFTLALRALNGASYVEGTVVDSNTGASLPDTVVAVKNRGWGFVNGGLVWDKEYVYQTSSDAAGRFRVVYDRGSSAHVTAARAGYQPYDDWHASKSSITIGLKQTNANYRPLPNGIVEIGMRASKPFGWIFSEQRITFDRSEADLFPDLPATGSGPTQSFTLHAPGGIVFIPVDRLPVSGDPLVAVDTAPAEGYTPSTTFDPEQDGLYFVKTRDGRAYAKFMWSSGYAGSEEEIRSGTWSTLLNYVYNPDGTRSLIFQRP